MLAAAAECGLDSIGKGPETRDRDDVLTALAESDALVDPCTGERLVLGQLRRAYFL